MSKAIIGDKVLGKKANIKPLVAELVLIQHHVSGELCVPYLRVARPLSFLVGQLIVWIQDLS